jgi:mannose-1-phosphate guanylyltransferase
VSGFTEKPDATEARRLMSKGALWNCGVFAQTIGYALGLAKAYISFNSYDSFCGQYRLLPEISYDCGAVVNEGRVGVVRYSGNWKDIGTWNALTEETDGKYAGRTVLSESCVNTHVINLLDIPLIVQGLSDAVVVAGPDGILISGKDESSKIKPLVDKVYEG